MSDIKTWHQRAMAHPDHQSGMISEGMIRARMCEEIEDLRAENERLRAKIKWLIEDDERLHYVLYRIANPPPFADCPVEMAQNATRGEHLRREAFDGIRRALEGKP